MNRESTVVAGTNCDRVPRAGCAAEQSSPSTRQTFRPFRTLRSCGSRLALLLFSVVPVAHADDAWTLTDASLAPVAVRNVSVDAGNVSGTAPDGAARSVALGSFVSLSRGFPAPVPAGKFVLHTSAGERLVGAPASSTVDAVTWSTLAVGDRVVPLNAIVAIDRATAEPTGEAAPEDVATLANHDTVRGVVAAVDGDNLVMTVGETNTTVALANLASVRFAATGAASLTKAALAVGLVDGSVVFADMLQSAGDSWTLSVGAERLSVSAAQVVRVDHLAGPVQWLSSLRPVVEYTPYLGESFPPVTDRTVTGEPLRAGGRTYDHGIGVHARTVLTYDLDGTRRSFRARYAGDPTLTLTDAVVRIRVDDRVAHEGRVRGGTVSPVVWADLTGAKRLTLEVDFGQGLHAQDRVNWLEPALLTTPPPAQ